MKQKVEKKKVAPIKILMGLFVPFILLTIFFSVLLNDATVDVGTGATDGKYASVLSGIDGIVEANPRLVLKACEMLLAGPISTTFVPMPTSTIAST